MALGDLSAFALCSHAGEHAFQPAQIGPLLPDIGNMADGDPLDLRASISNFQAMMLEL